MAIERLHLGCPAWGLASWEGRLFRRESEASRLTQYASVFNAVEGNTTFYALPSADTVARWCDDSPSGFRFCFKLPRRITHELQLRDAGADMRTFVDRVAPLGERLGPFMIQLPGAFGPRALPILDRFLASLPSHLPFAVEVRHPAFFNGGEAELKLRDLLAPRSVDRVLLDTRGLFDADPSDRHVAAARGRKPRLPVRTGVTGGRPIVRFVPHPEFGANRAYLEGWKGAIASWLDTGLEPYFFMHAPHDRDAPALARLFHGALRDAGLSVGSLPPFPGETMRPPPQLPLFE